MSDPQAPTQLVDQDALDRALFQTLIIAAAVGVLFVIIWIILRRCVPRMYAPHLFRETEAGKHFTAFWKWLMPLFTVSDDFLFEHRGMDTLMYTTFTRMMLWLMIAFFFFGIVILWPVDGTSSNRYLPQTDPNYVNGTAVLSFSNINGARSNPEHNRYAAHVVSVVFNSMMCYWLFVRTYNIYYRYTHKQWRKTDFSNYAVLVDNVSRTLSEEEISTIYNEHFPGQVLSVSRVMRAKQLHEAYLDRLTYDDMIQDTEWTNNANQKAANKKAAKKARKAAKKDGAHEIVTSVEMEDIEAGHVDPKYRDQIRDVTCGVPTCLCLQACCCWRDKVDRLTYLEQHIDELNTTMTKLEGKLKPTPSVFVTFRSRDAAAKAASTSFTRKRTSWFSEPAPDFNDLRWKNFELSHRERNIRYGIILALVIFVGLIFFIPTTFAQGLANLSTLASIPGFGWIKPLTEKYKTLTSFIEGILPSLVLTIAFVVAKIFLKKIVLLEGYTTRSHEFRSFSSKYFYLLILNVFLASIAAGTFITLYTSISGIVENPLSLITLLAQRLPTQVNFFINYMAVNSVITNLLPLLQPVRVLLRLACKVVFKGKTHSQRNWLRQYNWFHYHEEYPIQMLYFAITIAYSSLAPLIVPFSLIFFAIKYFVGQYHSLYIFKRRLESYGKYWPSAFNRLCAGVLIYQALMTGIFALQRYVSGIVVSGILMVVTVIYAVSVNYFYGPPLTVRSVEVHEDYKKPEHANLDVLVTHYRDPLRNWQIINEHKWMDGVWYNSRDRLRQLQLSVEHPTFYNHLQAVRAGESHYYDSVYMLLGKLDDAHPETAINEGLGSDEDPTDLGHSQPIMRPKKHKKKRQHSDDVQGPEVVPAKAVIATMDTDLPSDDDEDDESSSESDDSESSEEEKVVSKPKTKAIPKDSPSTSSSSSSPSSSDEESSSED